MATRKSTTPKVDPKGDPMLAVALAAPTWATFARAIGKDGKAVRTIVRGRFGSYVSKGDALTEPLKRAVYAYIVDGDKTAADTFNASK
jgi:hypothetical protein